MLFVQKFLAVISAILVFFMPNLALKTSQNTRAPEYYAKSGVKNVIYLIGDGMGPNHLEKTKYDLGIDLAMDTLPYHGRSKTSSLSDVVTDSAAGGTALACGVRTANSKVGVYMWDKNAKATYPMSITELCEERGMMTGVITSDSTSGATPASFTAHTSDRGNEEDISLQQMASDFDLIWGTASASVTPEGCEAGGYQYFSTLAEMEALEPGSRSIGQFTESVWHLENVNEDTPTLRQMANKAVDLLDDTDEGFFLMIEGAHIDKRSHANDDEGMVEALKEFDLVVSDMLDYAKADGDTLVVISADHETGKITEQEDGSWIFTRDSHSAMNVPVLVYGSNRLINDGEVLRNFEIVTRIAYSLGFTEEQFPRMVKVPAAE